MGRPATASPRRSDPRTEAWALMQELWAGQRGRIFSIAAEFELAPMQAIALKNLRPGHPIPMSELAGALRCDNSNVTGIADRLETRGLVKRRPGTHDRRVKMLELTAEGERVREQLHERMSRPPDPLAELPADEARALRDILRRALEGR